MNYRTATLSLLVTSAAPAWAQEVEVIHWLTAGAESAAIQELADAVEASGAAWVDLATPGGGADARALFTSRIAGGDAPDAMFLSIGLETAELAEQGILRDVSGFAEENDLVASVPEFALNLGRGPDGGLYALPLAFETQNFMWTSPPAFEAAGLEPPTTWDEFLSQAPALQEAGIIPLAVGEQAWQLNILFSSVLAGVAGPEQYMTVLRDHDEAAAGGEGVVRSFEVMRALSELRDDGASNRAWNDTLNLVAEGRAAAQVMGSWAGAELASMGHEYGTDWGCVLAGGDAVIVGATGFMFPEQGDDVAGQDAFVRALMDPAVQTAFSVQKGSIPARTDAGTESLSECSQLAAAAVSAGSGMPNMSGVLSSDGQGQIGDLLLNFWSDPSITAEDAAAQFAQIIASEG